MNVEEIIKTSKQMTIESRTLIHLKLVDRTINDTIASALKPYGVSLQQFNVLRILNGQAGKPANLSTLNERMVSKMSNTTRLVDKLLIKQFVNRKICPSNRRKIEITITQSGIEALKEMNAAMHQAESLILKNFSKDDLINLNTILDKF